MGLRRPVTLTLTLVLLAGVGVHSSPNPTLDFLDPFLTPEKEKDDHGPPPLPLEKEKDFHGEGADFREGGPGFGGGGGGALAASGHLDGGLGDIGFNADGSVAASKNFGTGLDNGIDVGFKGDPVGDEFQDKFHHNPQFQDDHRPRGPILRPRPPPPRINPHQQPQMQKQPCEHPLPRPLVPISGARFPSHGPIPPPPNQRDGPFFKKNFRGLTKDMSDPDSGATAQDETIHHKYVDLPSDKMARAAAAADPVLRQGLTLEQYDAIYTPTTAAQLKIGALNPQFDYKTALRLARNLLDKAILNKNSTKNSTKSNSTEVLPLPSGPGGDSKVQTKSRRSLSHGQYQTKDDFDFEPVDVDRDGVIGEDDEDFLKHARSLLNEAIQNQPMPANPNPNLQVKVNANLTDAKVNSSSNSNSTMNKRSLPILVLEEVKYVPLHNASSKNGSSSSPDAVNDAVVARSLPQTPNATTSNVNANATEVKGASASNSNATKREEERPISPKMSGISHMFHNMFAG